MTLEFRVGDVFERLAEIPDGSIDLVVTSPPFLALRSYLPADHPHKAREIGSEATPADFIETLLALTAEFGRVLAPHGSICVELGDTFAGSGGAGGDYKPGGMRDGQGKFDGSSRRDRASTHKYAGEWANEGYADKFKGGSPGGRGWPLAKSLTGIPTLYPWSLAYGRNLLSGAESPAGRWRIRNVIVWARPNPPVGALGDKFRPATSYITVACRSAKRYFDLDAVRTEYAPITVKSHGFGPDGGRGVGSKHDGGETGSAMASRQNFLTHAGAPPLDWHADDHPEDGDWLWKLSTAPYRGSHYATFPLELPRRLIEAMCPQRVCDKCGPVYSYHDDTGSTQDLRGMRSDVQACRLDCDPGTEGDRQEPVLFQDVLEPQHCQDAQHDQRSCTDEEGLSGDAQTWPSDGHEDGLRARTSTRNGGAFRPQPVGGRSSASPQRRQVGQPHRESRTARQASTRPDAEAGPNPAPVSVVRQPNPDPQECPTCKGPTRVGRVLDPFAGSGTTLAAAQMVGRHAIGVDLDERNAELARERVGMFLETVPAAVPAPPWEQLPIWEASA